MGMHLRVHNHSTIGIERWRNANTKTGRECGRSDAAIKCLPLLERHAKWRSKRNIAAHHHRHHYQRARIAFSLRCRGILFEDLPSRRTIVEREASIWHTVS